MTARHAFAPGRVNLIGDHTDYAHGCALPMAIERGTSATYTPSSSRPLIARSRTTGESLAVAPGTAHAAGSFGAMVTGIAKELDVSSGTIEVRSNLPLGAGLSSSASLLMACALALGAPDDLLGLAERCQRAEARAGQDVGLLDQLAIGGGVAGSALKIDFVGPTWRSVPVSEAAGFFVIHSGQRRSLATGAYAQRRATCRAAEAIIGPLGRASLYDLDHLDDATMRRRARHVITETGRVDAFANAIEQGALEEAGQLMNESHQSLSIDFEVSTATIDALVTQLLSLPEVHGARLTGGGFGGCVIALTDAGVSLPMENLDPWAVTPSEGARLL